MYSAFDQDQLFASVDENYVSTQQESDKEQDDVVERAHDYDSYDSMEK